MEMLSTQDLFHNGMGVRWGGLTEYASTAEPVTASCDAPADRHLISSIENSSVTQRSLKQVDSLTSANTHAAFVPFPGLHQLCTGCSIASIYEEDTVSWIPKN